MPSHKPAARRQDAEVPPSVPCTYMARPLFGHRNSYRCGSCGKSIVTVQNVPGTTPMFVACRATPGCGGRMTSGMGASAGEPTHQWRKPIPKEIEAARHASREMFTYLKRGGLFLDAIAVPGSDHELVEALLEASEERSQD